MNNRQVNQLLLWLTADKKRFALIASCITGVLGGITLVGILAVGGFPGNTLWIGFLVGAPIAGVMNWRGMVALGFFDKQDE